MISMSTCILLYLWSQVRFAALKVIEEMSRKLGDSYKVVLPETIVTLTELNEGELMLYAFGFMRVLSRPFSWY